MDPLPPEDLAVRSLLLRAYAGAKKKPNVVVVQDNGSAEARYRLLFPQCRYEKRGLETFLRKS